MTFSSSWPASAAAAIVASQPITWKQTWLTISGTDGFTLPGMIDEPGCTAGSRTSAMPARGPIASSRRSLATLPASTASRRIAPDTARTSPMLCVTRKRLAAGTTAKPDSRARAADRQPREVVAGVEARADRRRAEVQFQQLPRRLLHVVGAAPDARGVAAELLAQRHRHRVLQMRAADLQDVR